MAPPIKADTVIRAKAVHSLQQSAPVYRSLAVHGGRIWALSNDLHGLDDCIGPDTRVIDEPDQTFDVPDHLATCIDELVDLLHERAAHTEPGSWITTTANRQEYNLKGRRFPTAEELDLASTAHPIVLRRGDHNVIVNSLAAGRHHHRYAEPTRRQDRASRRREPERLTAGPGNGACPAPHAPAKLRRPHQGLESASAAYAAVGIGCVRDCAVPIADVPILMATRDSGKLHVRARALISSIGLMSASAVASLLN
ncbi:hypothetical protein QWA68_015420 [Fusarium oxysporum]|nr:hypothetical protein QWA68_015420 [Fusarium oxysporum]